MSAPEEAAAFGARPDTAGADEVAAGDETGSAAPDESPAAHGELPVVMTSDAPRGRHAGARARHVEIVVHPDATSLAEATAARLLVRLLDLQSLRSPLHVVLTGGTVGNATLAAVAASPVRGGVDWSGVHVWWGDERFVRADSPDRNERHAREALLHALPIPPANVHAIPAEGEVPDEDAAAAAYAAELARFSPLDDQVDDASPSGGVAPREAARQGQATEGGPAVPEFDVLLLGVGPDGHVASLFPGHAALHDEARTVVGEPDSPKPPPRRVSMTYPAICAAREVWLVVAGDDKAEAVASALTGARIDEIPAAGAVGTERTLWLVDVAAASKMPTA